MFRDERLVSGVRVRTSKAFLSKGHFLDLDFSPLRNDPEIFSFRPSTQTFLTEKPMRPDPFESKTVSCKKSKYSLQKSIKTGVHKTWILELATARDCT